MQRCAVFTIVQNEPVFLPLWLRHYGRHFAPADLYVLDHQSTDGSALQASRRCGARLVPVFREHSFDHDWLCKTVRGFQTFLLQSYRYVLFAEADEFVVPDPRAFAGLADFVEALEAPYARCLGLNVVHWRDREPPLDFKRPLLAQRSTCFASRMYCKVLLARVPLAWEIGFHVAAGANAPPDERLYLLHLHRADYDYCRQRHEASAKRHWNERDLRDGSGIQNRIYDPGEFQRWFYSADMGEACLEIPAHLRSAL